MPQRRYRSYDTLLRVRERQEHIKAQALAEVRREIHAHEDQRDALLKEQARMFTEAARHTRTAISAPRVHGYYLYERHLAREAVEEDARIHQLRRVEDSRREELEEAMTRRRMVERLKERLVREYMDAIRKDEQKVSDDLAAGRAARERSGESER